MPPNPALITVNNSNSNSNNNDNSNSNNNNHSLPDPDADTKGCKGCDEAEDVHDEDGPFELVDRFPQLVGGGVVVVDHREADVSL